MSRTLCKKVCTRSARHGDQRQFFSLQQLCVAALVLLLLAVAAAATPAVAAPPSFRCLRPFSAMDSFVDVAKSTTTQNCDFLYFTVTAASADLHCAAEAGADTASSCNVTLRWSMLRADDVVQRLKRQVGTDADYFTQNTAAASAAALWSSTSSPQQQQKVPRPASTFVTEEDDVWRYSVALRAKGDSTVHYKGFGNGDGYSACCACLVEGECAWMSAEKGDNDLTADEEVGEAFPLLRTRVLRGCPLPFPTAAPSSEDGDDALGAPPGLHVALTDLDDGEDGEAVFHGEVTKPLHRVVEGPWEATVEMWRRRQSQQPTGSEKAVDATVEPEVLGRVVMPFELSLPELRAAGRVRDIVSMALAVEEAAVAEEEKGDL